MLRANAMRLDTQWVLAFGLALVLLSPGAAWAGCGCDHPPPAWEQVMPPFASPGKVVQLNADGFEFTPGETYEVKFGSGSAVPVVATESGAIRASVPSDAEPGPAAIEVDGADVSHVYSDASFTVLRPAPMVPAEEGTYVYTNFELSVAADGTVLIPFNLADVREGTQFAMQLGGFRLAFGQDDVVFYNADGVDLTLFTLDTDDPTNRQWGSYFGWQVDQDTGIQGTVFREKIWAALATLLRSDMLTYWRHEFHTYAAAHEPGGSHEVGEDGYHKNLGTLHVDHDHLVLAIAGSERHPFHPHDASKNQALQPGSKAVNLFVAMRHSENPVEPEEMDLTLDAAILDGSAVEMVAEPPTAYDDDEDDD